MTRLATSRFTIVVAALAALAVLGGVLVLGQRSDRSEPDAVQPDPDFEPVSLDDPDIDPEPVVETADTVPERADLEGDEPAPTPMPGQSGKKEREEWKSAVLHIVTNFEKADVTINGIAYPEYISPGEPEGVVLPAGGPYYVEVTYDGKTKSYRIYLRPYETRLLMVELSGFGGGKKSRRPERRERRRPRKKKEEEKKEEKEEQGKVTVYSKPTGDILMDGDETGERTPGTVEVDSGRHEVQVKFEGGGISEKKIVRVRGGSRIKLFFREKKK